MISVDFGDFGESCYQKMTSPKRAVKGLSGTEMDFYFLLHAIKTSFRTFKYHHDGDQNLNNKLMH